MSIIIGLIIFIVVAYLFKAVCFAGKAATVKVNKINQEYAALKAGQAAAKHAGDLPKPELDSKALRDLRSTRVNP